MNFESRETRDAICSICGEHIGRGFDHAECAKEKQAIHASKKRVKAKKKLGKKNIDYLAGLCG